MRYSKLFGKTHVDAPHDESSVNARLLMRGGFIDKVAAGIYNLLPLGIRVFKKINTVIREEMDAVGGQELLMPALHPIELWKQTGRDKTMDEILYRTHAGDKEFVLGPSHEETVTPLAAKTIKSYKDLPMVVYQIQTKFRNEPRAKSGLLRGREFGMKDMYSFHATKADLDEYYEKVKRAYLNVYKRCGLDVYVMSASGGPFSEDLSHEFAVKTSAGEDTMILCAKCNLAQNLEIAEGKIPDPDWKEDKEKPLSRVDAKRGQGIAEGEKLHKIPGSKILKTVVYVVEDKGFAGIMIRGDLNVNENKLMRYFGKRLRPATSDELVKAGLIEGFISPVKNEAIPFFADFSIKYLKNLCTGANEKHVDYLNANIGRDFVPKDFADFVEVNGGFACPKCGGELSEEKAIEAGNIFKLGIKYSEPCNLKFVDENGKERYVIMGCYGIGNTRLMGAIVEVLHDDKGIIWPKTVAPYNAHLISIGAEKDVTKAADDLYEKLRGAGVEVLYDDRNESPGKKFNDADLIGIPLRIVVSAKTLKEKSAELKERTGDKPELVALKFIVDKILNII